MIAVAILFAVSDVAAAQGRVRVVAAHSVVWRLTSTTPLTTVEPGTELELLGRDGNWYIVRLPQLQGMPAGEIGRMAVAQAEVIGGGQVRELSIRQLAETASTPTPSDTRIGIFGFGQAGYNRWLAHDAFAAVLGSGASPMLGGGVRVLVGDRLGVDVAIERFEKSGQRVFINNGQVFPLGIRDTIRVIPIYITGIYRQRHGSWTAYGGGGIARYAYRETSDFADPAENVNDHFGGYHVVFGVEFGARASMFRAAVEGQATNVPDAFGATGAAAIFDEHNLGGFQIRVRLLAGRQMGGR